MSDGALRVLVDGEVALLLRDAGVKYEEYYHAVTHAAFSFPLRESIEEAIAYGPTPSGRVLRMRYRVLPNEGIHLRKLTEIQPYVYERLITRVKGGAHS